MLKPNYCTKSDIILHEKMHGHDLFGTFFRFELSCILVMRYCVIIFQLRLITLYIETKITGSYPGLSDSEPDIKVKTYKLIKVFEEHLLSAVIPE